ALPQTINERHGGNYHASYEDLGVHVTACLLCIRLPRKRLCSIKSAARSCPCQSQPASDSEFRAAAEAELLNLVVRLLRERERVVEPQRPERRFPNHADADRAANMHAVIDRARRRIGNARAPAWTDTTRNTRASGGECRRAGVVP